MDAKAPETGLTGAQARALLAKYGRNEPAQEKKEGLLRKLLQVLRQPMFLLLMAAAVIYFLLGQPGDGVVMLVFVAGIVGIDVVQEWKTDRTLNALRDLSAPHARVIRDGGEKTIPSAELVPGDLMLLSEGVKIPADGVIVRANDLCVDESTLTGEPEGVWKSAGEGCFAGTLVTQGSALVRVQKTGAGTEYGKIGTRVAEAPDRPTPLEKQTARLVRLCAAIAAGLFLLVFVITFFNSGGSLGDRATESVLSGITLAMAMIPEEFPVILTVFLSMGAWRLARRNSLVRRLPAVETLGAISVLCVDKTGTITVNQMTVSRTWTADEGRLCRVMGMACETEAYDPMEKAMLAYCARCGLKSAELFSGALLAEYPFTNESKMMGHAWRRPEGAVVAAKGSPEHLLKLCAMPDAQREKAEKAVREMSDEGLRVIAVGEMRLEGDTPPRRLDDAVFDFCGLVGLSDPPRPSVREDIRRCVRAGVRVVMLTGDNGVTAAAIARQVGMPESGRVLTGDELDAMTDDELRARVGGISVFARVVPEHKMRIVQALRNSGEVVAMTGDGVNDAPALKYADIGIAMGKRGSEVSREAADLVLLDDNFSTIVDTVRDGRRIFDNIRKAVGYVFTIHIPIALASLLAPLLGIGPGALMLLPLHIVLLELIIDPTCSVVLERQPAERDIMERPPRRRDAGILTAGSLVKSVAQGLALFAAAFGLYYASVLGAPQHPALARTMGLVVLFIGNIFLVLVNSSEHDFMFRTIGRLLRDKVVAGALAGTAAALVLMLYTPLSAFFRLTPLSVGEFLTAAGIAIFATVWYELVKLFKRLSRRRG
jgi:Ca2+-transporting ATPase